MSSQDIINTLRQSHIMQQLKDAGISHLRLFGSYAQNCATADSNMIRG